MKVLMLNGSPHAAGCTFTALKEIADVLHQESIEAEILHIGNRSVPGCIACARCKTTGHCIYGEDGLNDLIDRLDDYDALVVGSPVYFSAPAGQLVSFLNRLFYAAGPRLRHKPGCAVVSCRRGGASAAFDVLNKYFTVNHMPLISSQYWNQVHGNTPQEVQEDAEGLQTMRHLGHNLAWILRCIACGREAGIMPPTCEELVKTNFVR